MREIKIDSFENFVSTVAELYKTWNKLEFNNLEDALIYRGMSDGKLHLFPGVFRKLTFKDYRKNIFESPSIPATIINIPYCFENYECDIITRFSNETDMYIDLKSIDNSTVDIQTMEIAQHHYLPTRLLDWTMSPLVALFFACVDNIEEDGKVCVLNHILYKRLVNKIDPSNISTESVETIASLVCKNKIHKIKFEFPIPYNPMKTIDRIVNQKGLFMIWGKNNTPLEDIFNKHFKKDFDNLLTAIIIPKELKSLFIAELGLCGISYKTLFPSLDSISKDILNIYRNKCIL